MESLIFRKVYLTRILVEKNCGNVRVLIPINDSRDPSFIVIWSCFKGLPPIKISHHRLRYRKYVSGYDNIPEQSLKNTCYSKSDVAKTARARVHFQTACIGPKACGSSQVIPWLIYDVWSQLWMACLDNILKWARRESVPQMFRHGTEPLHFCLFS